MADPPDFALAEGAPWLLETQVQSILGWFEIPDSVRWAEFCCRRQGLPVDMAGDIHSETWVKVRSALLRRREAFPLLHDAISAHRYAARSVQRTAIDLARHARRVESRTQLMDDHIIDPTEIDHISKVDDTVIFDRWRRSVIAHARHDFQCSGCPNDVVFAAALKLLAMMQIGDKGTISDLMYEVLRDVDDDFPEERSEAARQRKSRCSRCVLALLRDAAQSAGIV